MRLIVLCLLAISIGYAQRKVANPSFEEGELGSVPNGWFVPSVVAKAGFTVKVVDRGCYSGARCAMMTGVANRPENIFGYFNQSLPAGGYTLRHIRLRAAIRVEGEQTRAQMWLRLDRSDNTVAFLENMKFRPVFSSEWKTYDIETSVAEDVSEIVLGVMLFGGGTAWIDDVSIDVLNEADRDGIHPPDVTSVRSLADLEEALAMAREFKNRVTESRILTALGLTYASLSQYEKALGYFDQSLALARELKDPYNESATLFSLGVTYAGLSQHEKAIGYFEQALAIGREIKDSKIEMVMLGFIGSSYNKSGQYETAIGYFDQTLAIARRVKEPLGEVLALDGLGATYNKLGQYEKAGGYLEQALKIARKMIPYAQTLVLADLGGAYTGLGKYEQAIGHLDRALAMAREDKSRDIEVDSLSRLMEAWKANGKPRLAVLYGKQAINTVQSIRFDIRGLTPELQQSFLKGNEKPYHALVELLIAQGRLAEAEQVLALLKEQEYFQYVRRDSAELPSANRAADLTAEEAEWSKRYLEIGDRLVAIGTERGDLLAKKTLSSEQTQRLTALEQDLAVGNQAFQKFLGDLSTHFSAKPEAGANVEQIREAQGMMEQLRELPRGTVVIHTVVGADKYYAILRTPDTQKAYEYPIKAADLNRKVLEFRQVVRDPKLDPRPQAQELYNILVAPLAKDLRQANARTLMFSLDGILRYLPLAALYDGKQYLIEQYRVSVITLASNMALKDKPDATWRAAGFGVTKAFEGSAALPSVSGELSGIISSTPGDRGVLAGEIKLDGQFTQQAMRQALLKRYQVVHIASHFRFQPGNETQSFLLLGDGAHLSMAELKTSANLFGGVQLLTLSACNTGMGDGAEVEGFGTLAQRQGAKAVIASLWPVADASTSRLMQEFYRIRQSSAGKTKLEALQEAQLELLRGVVKAEPGAGDRALIHEPEEGLKTPPAPPFPYNAKAPFSHPYYWAPFFLMGNWL